MPAKRNSSNASAGGNTTVSVGRTRVTKDYKEGASSIWVESAMELFGPLVELIKVDGSYKTQFVKNAAPQTVMLGAHSPCVNVEMVTNNELVVTPISVRKGGSENDPVVFGSCGPSGLSGIAHRIKQAGRADDSRRVDFGALRAELAALESIGIDISAGEKNDKKARQEEAGMKAGYWFDGSVPRLGFKTDKELEAEETESRADASFWDGMEYERLKDPIKLFYCPIIESRSECDLGARLAYTEAARLFGRCIDLDKTHIPYYAKRCAALCKLHMFPRALSDAESYISLRPASPTGHCLKGVVYDGLNKYNESIASLEKALERAEIIPYDSSRVWSVGTLVSDNLRRAIERREKVADRASVANQHGVKWRKLGEFGRAVPCLVEALQLQKDCVGNMHLHYATCLNNLGSCLEAMGNYEDAMKHYKDSLSVSEMASPGTLRVMVCAARHLPHVMKGGELQMIDGKLEWVEQGESCDTYVEVELVEELHLGSMSRSKPARTKVAKKNYQPTWNQMLTIQSERGDRSVVVRLMGRNPQRFALEEAAAHKRKQIQGPLHECQELDARIQELKARMQRLKEIGRAKVKDLERVERQYNLEIQRVENLAVEIERLKHDEQLLLQRQKRNLDDVVIGQFIFSITTLSADLKGQARSSFKKWLETPDLQGEKVRGEDLGVVALQLEMTWSPECEQYATRLCNIGNLHRILADKVSCRGGSVSVDLREELLKLQERNDKIVDTCLAMPSSDQQLRRTAASIRHQDDDYKRQKAVCEQYKKLDEHYSLAEQHLEAALAVMERAKSLAPPRHMTTLEAERAKQQGGEEAGAASSSSKVPKVDGKRTVEYCVVLENMALLCYSRSLGLAFPKGTPESVKTTFQAMREKSQRRAVQLLEEVKVLRESLPGLGGATDEYLRLLRLITGLHAQPKTPRETSINYPDALPVQEEALVLSKKVHGDKSAQSTRDVQLLAHLHLRLGKAEIKEGDYGSWVIDDAESWHWDMVTKLARRVDKASASAHGFTSREAQMLLDCEQSMAQERIRIHDPPPITEYSEPTHEDPLLKKAKAEAVRKVKTRGALGEIKMSRAVATKLRAPATELVRMDQQGWPNNALHTNSS